MYSAVAGFCFSVMIVPVDAFMCDALLILAVLAAHVFVSVVICSSFSCGVLYMSAGSAQDSSLGAILYAFLANLGVALAKS